jgi:outer membrane scaffolding protein for murein synthesis (MipA/OmpV family)
MHLKYAVLTGILFISCNGLADELPKWELGAGFGTVTLADYRGSKEYNSVSLPFPYLEYRGKFFKADREDGMRGQLFKSHSLELNISGAFSPTTDADENTLREGMPTLEPTFELGTTLDINLSGDSLSDGWLLRLPARAVYTYDSGDFEHIGWLMHPQLAYRNHRNHWNVRAYSGPIWGNHSYHDYYYSVAPEYTRPEREAYEVGSGYSGFASGISVTRRWGRLWAGAFVRYDNLANATFENSPLVETRHYLALGVGVAWVFAAADH